MSNVRNTRTGRIAFKATRMCPPKAALWQHGSKTATAGATEHTMPLLVGGFVSTATSWANGPNTAQSKRSARCSIWDHVYGSSCWPLTPAKRTTRAAELEEPTKRDSRPPTWQRATSAVQLAFPAVECPNVSSHRQIQAVAAHLAVRPFAAVAETQNRSARRA